MRATIFIAAIIGATTALASAIPIEERTSFDPCTGTLDSAQCCATDVLGLADLDCAPPPRTPKNQQDFRRICASIGQRARCCLLPILGQALVCQAPG